MIARFLSNVDLFGIPVSINFSGKEKATTSFGGICSFLFFIFLGWAIYNGAQDLFSTDNPQIISYEAYSEDPRLLTLSLDEFPISFAMRTPTDLEYQLFTDESIFKINFYLSSLERKTLSNGTTQETWVETPITLEKCKLQYFGELASSFSDLNLNSMYCISKSQSELDKLKLQGAFTSKIYQSLTLRISQCDNSTSNTPCAPPETIKSYLSGSWFSSLYGNMVVNPRNYEHPNFKFKDLYYTMLSPDNYRETEIDLGRVQMTTDKGWLLEDPKIQTYVKVNKITEFLQFEPSADKVLISCIFQLSKLENFYSRIYKKLPGVLAEIGGLADAVLIILFMLTNPYFKLKFREALMNELFDIRMLPKTPNKKINSPKETQRKLFKSNKKAKSQKNNSQDEDFKTNNPPKDEIQVELQSEKTWKKLETMDPSEVSTTHQLRINFESMKKSENSMAFSRPFNGSLTPLTNKNTKQTLEAKESNSNLIASPSKYRHAKAFSIKHTNLSGPQERNTRSAESLNDIDILVKGENLDTKAGAQKEKSTPLQLKFLEEENIEKCSFSFESPTDTKDIEKKMEIKNEPETKRRTEENEERELNQTQKASERKHDQILETNKTEKEDNNSSESEEVEIISREKSTKVDITIWEYICSFLYKSKDLKQKIGVIDEGVKNIDERLDVINIMKKLREIDKLKALLLDHDQLVLFNNLPKPEIFAKGFHKLIRSSSFTHSILKRTKFVEDCATEQQVLQSYEELKYKTERTEMDEKLLEIFSQKKS